MGSGAEGTRTRSPQAHLTWGHPSAPKFRCSAPATGCGGGGCGMGSDRQDLAQGVYGQVGVATGTRHRSRRSPQRRKPRRSHRRRRGPSNKVLGRALRKTTRRHGIPRAQRGAENRHFGSLRPASLRRHMRSAAPFSPQFCTCAPTAERRCPLGSVLADEQPHRSRIAAVSRSERSAQAP